MTASWTRACRDPAAFGTNMGTRRSYAWLCWEFKAPPLWESSCKCQETSQALLCHLMYDSARCALPILHFYSGKEV